MVEGPVEGPSAGTGEPAAKGRGCLFWGGITLLILLVVTGVLIGMVGYPAYRMLMKVTSPTPAEIPVYKLKEGEHDALVKRISAFENAPEPGPPSRLELSADDLNALIAGDPDLKVHAGEAFVRIDGDKFFLDESVSLDAMPFISFLFKGRYLNLTFQLKLAIEGGRLKGTPEVIVANQEPLPEEMMTSSRERNVFERMSSDKTMTFFNKAKSAYVKDGKLVLER
jgi:hypothetical protein